MCGQHGTAGVTIVPHGHQAGHRVVGMNAVDTPRVRTDTDVDHTTTGQRKGVVRLANNDRIWGTRFGVLATTPRGDYGHPRDDGDDDWGGFFVRHYGTQVEAVGLSDDTVTSPGSQCSRIGVKPATVE